MVILRATRAMALLVIAMVGLATPVSVAAADSGAPTGNHCVARLQAIQPGTPEARVAAETCFQTFAEAISYATHGYTQLPADAKPDSLTQSMLPDSVTTEYVLGIDYDRYHYEDWDGSKTWTASNGCDFSHYWVVSDVGSAWNNRISSAKGYSGCVRYRHFEDINYGGALVTCTCYYVGDAMNDRTSSLQFDD